MRIVHGLYCLILCAGSALAQPLSFRQLTSEGPKPSARVDGTIAYDNALRRIALFGGQDNSARNDLWVYTIETQRWEQIQPAGPLPPARFGHTSLFDGGGRLIVFGGQSTGFFSDVWAFDFGAGTWKQLANDGAGPSRRYGHSMIYEPGRDRIVISHGFTNSGRFDDTWAFDLRTNTWRDLSPSGTRPLRRCLHHAVHDEKRGQMLLYGGCASGFGPCPLGDLWSFDLATQRWTEIAPAQKPSPRMHFGRAFSPRQDRMLLFGGSGNGLLNDLWSFDASARSWQAIDTGGEKPSARDRHESAYAADTDSVFFFGGSTFAGLSNELWMLGPGAVIRSVQNAFSGEEGPVAPGQLVSLFGSFGNAGPPQVTLGGLPVRLLYAAPDQINLQVPSELPAGSETELAIAGAASKRVQTRAASPGLFPAAFHADGTLVTSSNAAAAGEVITLYATGHGPAAPVALAVQIADRPAVIVSAQDAAPGVLRIDVRLEESGAISLTVAGVRSKEINIPRR